ncbi:MAG: hypothetical protein N2512_08570 [Armatimonadetes bacterium]|nr:hypothetical protein [Armatimonadota bacterium]
MKIDVVILALLISAVAAADGLLPWQKWVEVKEKAETKDLEELFDLPWASVGGPEGELSVAEERGPWGGKYFRFHVKVDWDINGRSWPSFETQPRPNLDFGGYTVLRYWIRCETARTRAIAFRFILWTGGQLRINEIIRGVKAGQWVQAEHRLADIPDLDKVDRIHFYLDEADYENGEELEFLIGGFQLARYPVEKSKLAAGEAAMGLWVGERADTSDHVVILDQGHASLPVLLVIETGGEAHLRPDDRGQFQFYEVFTGEEREKSILLDREVRPGSVERVNTEVAVDDLPPGYYLVVADLRRDGQSLLSGRVGCDDLYIRNPGESMTYTVLSIRTGMVEWLRDRLYGGVMCGTKIALPHVYDPRNPDTYAQFLDLFAWWTGKHTEGDEAGDTGLVLAAEAFRKSGDIVRCRYVESVLDDSLRHKMEKMQAPSGGCISHANQLADAGIGKGTPSESFGHYDSNQIGEWMRCFAYAIIYYRNVPGREEWVRKLNAACRRAADFLVAHSVKESDGIPKVMRHLGLREKPDGTVEQTVYYQEGRQCDVYVGRALAGLSYYAYAMQLIGEQVPAEWFEVMDNTVHWAAQKMKPNGWFDWQCEDIVEGGCHTFLGNIYIGEGIFGVYLANRVAGREDAARVAAEAAHKAYRYVTDDCYIKGQKYEYPLEFWVGPYVYWLFTEWLDTVGPEPAFEDWLEVLDRRWSTERGWKDFLDRGPHGVGRSDYNGMLVVAILGYLGIKHMAEIGKPLDWDVTPHRAE